MLESYFECSGEHPRFVAQECLLAAVETRLPIWKSGTPKCMRLLLNAASWASRGPSQIACQVPPSLVMRVRQNCATGGLQVSFTNYAQAPVHTPGFSRMFNRDGPTLAKAFRRTEWPAYVSPVKDVHVYVKRVGKGLPRVETLSGPKPPVHLHRGKLHLSFDEIIEGEVIILLPQ